MSRTVSVAIGYAAIASAVVAPPACVAGRLALDALKGALLVAMGAELAPRPLPSCAGRGAVS